MKSGKDNREKACLLKAVYYTVEVHNFDLQEKTTENNNNTITAKWVKPKIVIELTNCKM